MTLAENAAFSAKFSLGIAFIIFVFQVPSILLQLRLGKHKHLFKCIRCGNCCRLGFIELSDGDIDCIRKDGHDDFVDIIKSGKRKLKKDRGLCVFLKDNSCSIYNVRPEVCRKFPFFSLYGRINYARLWMNCPALVKLIEEVKDEGKSS